MARGRGVWAEIQRERANRQRLEQQARRAAAQAALRAERQSDQARRAAARQLAANERERKQLYIADRKAEAAAMVSDLRTRLAELDSVLADGIREQSGISFALLKHSLDLPEFDPGAWTFLSLNRNGTDALHEHAPAAIRQHDGTQLL